jgi:hypothetical protein
MRFGMFGLDELKERESEMKIEVVMREEETIFTYRSVEIETDNYDNLKGLTLDELNEKIEDEGTSFEVEESVSLHDVIYEDGDITNEKSITETPEIESIEEVDD